MAAPEHQSTRIRLHFWTAAGAQSVVVQPRDELRRRCDLLAEGAVFLRRERLDAAA
ncbi:MAG: hypothetical protein VKK98_02465 [Cyanobacteriota bacterium]|nr:hypothetical protein [Cyanobacteriota bacterium]